MAKWAEPSEETFKDINTVLSEINLSTLINTKIIVNDDQKKKVITLKKMPSHIKFAFNYDLLLIINESIYDGLTDEQKKLCIEEALSGTHFNYDNDSLIVGPPDVKTYHGFLSKHGFEQYEILEESIKTLYESQKNNANLETE